MQSEDKYLFIAIFLVCTMAAIVFGLMRPNALLRKPANAALPTLPSNITRQQAIGANYGSDERVHKPYLLIEFGDYQCPPCQEAYGLIEDLVARKQEKIGLIFRHLPLEKLHAQAFNAATYAEAAREQGKFWEMHELLYNTTQGLEKKNLDAMAGKLHLNMEAFRKALATTARKRVEADRDAAAMLHIEATPTLLLCRPNGKVESVQFEEVDREIK